MNWGLVKTSRVLGIDPGLNITGYAVLEASGSSIQVVEAGVVRSRREKEFADRILDIYNGVAEIIEQFHPEVLALEKLYSLTKRPETAILMAHARGVIYLAATQAGIPVIPYAATQVKKLLTGNGRAPKDQMQRAIQHELKLQEYPNPPDVADALAIALCHCFQSKVPPELR
ncbi:MAG: crossover junction endodeoxyribonuclease RuvC [Thermoguttaceae bacterium]|nr:crossover junction endodeoxyribonuclease RuvC [Thermoguttaceae bacterium]